MAGSSKSHQADLAGLSVYYEESESDESELMSSEEEESDMVMAAKRFKFAPKKDRRGFKRCGKVNCDICEYAVDRKSFKSCKTGKTYDITEALSCYSKKNHLSHSM